MLNEVLDELTSNISIRISVGNSVFWFFQTIEFSTNTGATLPLPAILEKSGKQITIAGVENNARASTSSWAQNKPASSHGVLSLASRAWLLAFCFLPPCRTHLTSQRFGRLIWSLDLKCFASSTAFSIEEHRIHPDNFVLLISQQSKCEENKIDCYTILVVSQVRLVWQFKDLCNEL